MAVASMRRPREFVFPASEHAMDRMFEELGEDDLRKLATEFIEALEQSRAKDDLVPVYRVLEAWYRTTLLRRDPDHARLTSEATDRAEGRIPPGVETQTVEQLRDEIARRRRAS